MLSYLVQLCYSFSDPFLSRNKFDADSVFVLQELAYICGVPCIKKKGKTSDQLHYMSIKCQITKCRWMIG